MNYPTEIIQGGAQEESRHHQQQQQQQQDVPEFFLNSTQQSPYNQNSQLNQNSPSLFASLPAGWGLQLQSDILTSHPNVMRRPVNHNRSGSYDGGTNPDRINRRAHSMGIFVSSEHQASHVSENSPLLHLTHGDFSTSPTASMNTQNDSSPNSIQLGASMIACSQNKQPFSFMNGSEIYRNSLSHTPRSSLSSIDLSSNMAGTLNSQSTVINSPSASYHILTPKSPFPTSSDAQPLGPPASENPSLYQMSSTAYAKNLVNEIGMKRNINESPALQNLEVDEIFGENEARRCLWANCEMFANNVKELVDHISTIHIGSKKSSYFCEWSDCSREQKPFAKRHKLYQHLRTHTGERPFVCLSEGCGKRFARQDGLNTHTKTHLDIKPFVCKISDCGKAYYHIRSLRKHGRTHLDGSIDNIIDEDLVSLAIAARTLEEGFRIDGQSN